MVRQVADTCGEHDLLLFTWGFSDSCPGAAAVRAALGCQLQELGWASGTDVEKNGTKMTFNLSKITKNSRVFSRTIFFSRVFFNR